MLHKLLLKIPFFKRRFEEKQRLIYENNIKRLRQFNTLINEHYYSVKNLIDLETIIRSMKIDHTIIGQLDMCTKVTFYSISSHGSLETIRKQHYYRETIENSKLIHLSPHTVPLNMWWSGDESVYYFIVFMKKMLNKKISLENETDFIRDSSITSEEREFLNSLLFNLHLSDFLSLILLITEKENVR